MRLVLVWAAVLVGVPAALPGCVACEPTEGPVSIGLSLREEANHALPILASGAMSVAGIEVPDSHGRLAFDVAIHNATGVDIDDLRLDASLDGRPLPAEITHVDGPSWRGHDGIWEGSVRAGGRIEIHWTVDRGPLSGLDKIVLDEGSSLGLTLSFAWTHYGCEGTETGTLTETTESVVLTAADAEGFSAAAPVDLTATAAGASVEGSFRTQGGTLTWRSAQAVVVFLPETGAPSVAVATLEGRVDGAAASTVRPGELVRVANAAPAPFSPPAVGEGIHLTVVEIEYRDGGRTERDRFGYVGA